MVGVPGRSNACHTCKKRKKRCDQQRPHCGQCKDTRMVCEGYARRLIFINSDQKHSRTQKGRYVPNQYSPLTSIDSYRGSRDIGQPARLGKPPSLLKHCLESSAWESKYFEVYWTSLLPNGQVFSPQATQYSTAGWSGVVQDLCYQDNLVRQALLANAIGLLGHHSGQHSIVMEGWRAYGRSLQMLSRSLLSMSQENHDKILATTMLLKQYQLLDKAETQHESTAAATWLKHAPGEQAIIAAKPPSHYAHGHAHRLFVDTRLNLLYYDIQRRKRSIFSSPAWKSDPWIACTKDPKDELLDILVDVPGLLEDFDSFLACSPKQAKQYRRLRQQLEAKCWKCDDQLERWANTSGASTLKLVEAVISTNIDQSETPSSVDLAMAHLGMVYWSTCILTYYPLWTVVGTMHEKLLGRVTPRQYCRNIALLMPYFLSPGVGDFSINMTGFAVIVALRHLARVDRAEEISEEREMLLNSFSGEGGRRLRNFLKGWPGRSDRVSHKGAEQALPPNGSLRTKVSGD